MRDSRASDSDSGAEAVEFALVLPFLVLLVLGIIAFGNAYWTKMTLNDAARQGARALATGRDPGAAVAGSGAGATLVSAVDGDVGSPVSVTVEKKVPFLIPGISKDDLTLQSKATMRKEAP